VPPVDPNHAYVDVAHPKTIVGADFRYDCHSDKVGPGPRGRARKAWFQSGWRVLQRGDIVTRDPVMVEIETPWLPKTCGHIEQPGLGSDPACAGCENRGF
jgi:hypothetical protein